MRLNLQKSVEAALDLNGIVQQMDAEKLIFENEKFDFIWSWGVIHHSANTVNILREMNRVLKPGGKIVTMIYYRSWWHNYVMCGLLHGIILGDFWKTKSIHKTVQRRTDGALARYYSINEWKEILAPFFGIKYIKVVGSKTQIFPFPGGRFKNFILKLFPSIVTRFLANKLKMGTFLIAEFHKRYN